MFAFVGERPRKQDPVGGAGLTIEIGANFAIGPIAVQPVDFRRGIDGLARLCQESLQHDPFAGVVFVFRNRRATAVKLLMYDGQGFGLCHKRISQGRFPWWPSADDGAAKRLAAHQLAVLLSAGDPTRTGAAADWRPVGPPV